ncbi:MAG: helix-turn-helix domain-containing protein [Marvinbryantia sp.]
MNQTNKYPPYAIIDKAVNGDESAITLLLKYYEAYISKLCL